MKKVLYIILTTIMVSVNAQNSANRLFYELTYKPSKDSAKLEKEMMALDIDKNKSVYQSYENIQLDSLGNVLIQESSRYGQMPDIKRFGNRDVAFTHQILKTYPIREVVYKDRIALDYYSYRENSNLTWKISDEKQKIGIYNTQKASTDFGGRKWIAWFTAEIPFQDGPYKFYGLPGLIVMIEDDAKNYSWELKGIRKIDHIADTSYMEDFMSQTGLSNSKEVSKEKFIEKYEQYKKDPFAGMRQMLGQISSDITLSDEFSMSKEMREAEKQMKEKLSENNNSIELSGKNQ